MIIRGGGSQEPSHGLSVPSDLPVCVFVCVCVSECVCGLYILANIKHWEVLGAEPGKNTTE